MSVPSLLCGVVVVVEGRWLCGWSQRCCVYDEFDAEQVVNKKVTVL